MSQGRLGQGWGRATGSPVSFRRPWSSSRMFSHLRSLRREGEAGLVLGSLGLSMQGVGETGGEGTPSPVHDARAVAVGHGTDQLPEQPTGLLLFQPWVAAVARHGVDVLQQVPAGRQLQHQVGALAVVVGLIELHLPEPVPSLPSPKEGLSGALEQGLRMGLGPKHQGPWWERGCSWAGWARAVLGSLPTTFRCL